MQMTMRWFGPGHDPVTLDKIRQVPGVTGVVTTLFDKLPGDRWEESEIKGLKDTVEKAGLKIACIESVNIHDTIKTGAPERDKHIETYIETLERLGKADIHLVCYNFMPVFDWTRSDLAKPREDGSTVLAYDQKIIDTLTPDTLFDRMRAQSHGHTLAGWEPARLAKIKELLVMYKDVTEEKLIENFAYFIKCIMPVCDKYDINMAIHPDDPAWSVFGLQRIVTGKEKILRLMKLVDNPHNGVTLCTGSLGTNPQNDIPDIIKSLKGRIHFAHVRNLRHTAPGVFEEAAHLSSDGSMNMYAIVKALYDIGFQGPIRPDHGRAIWGETESIPGYGLYDRALGAAYINGLWEALEKR